MPKPLHLTAALLLAAAPALASSEEEWLKFRENVSTACLALATELTNPEIQVNPFGSETYGVALLTTAPADGTAPETYACIYGKTDGTAELTAPFQ